MRDIPSSTVGIAGGTVYGTVSSATGAPVVRARVEVLGTSDATISDSLGSYVLSRLPAGTSTLRVTGPGFDDLTVRAMVPRAGTVHIDVILSPTVAVVPAAALPPVHVKSVMLAISDDTSGLSPRKPGVWEWKGRVADAPESSGEPDVFRLLMSDPHAMMRSDGFGGTPVDEATGAIQDHVFVNGLPVWNSVHGAGPISAIDPDVVSDLRVSDGSASARYGNALFQTVDVQTRETALPRPLLGAGLGPTAARGWWASPVRVGDASGQLLVAGRRSSTGIFPDRSEVNSVADRWSDGLAVLSLHRRNTAVQLIAIGSGDRLAADVDDAMLGARVDSGPTASPDQTLNVPWHSTTVGAVWTQQLTPLRKLVTKTWDARFQTSATSNATSRGSALFSRAREVGVESELSSSSVTVGASMESIHTSYNTLAQSGDLSRLGGVMSTGVTGTIARLSPYSLQAAPTIAAVYAERRWGSLRDRWSATSGIRATALSNHAPFIEPRLALSVDIAKGTVATAGYASTHQFVQSVRDVAAAAGTLVPVSSPVAAGSAGVPVAAAQTLSADLSRNFGDRAKLTLGAYDRKFGGLISPAPSGVISATGNSFDLLAGHTIGLGNSLQLKTGNLATQVTYGIQRTTLSQNSLSYFPPTELVQTGSVAVEWRAAPATRLRILNSIGSSFPGTADLVNYDAAGYGANLRGDAGLSESRLVGKERATSDALPMYARTDLGVIHEWRTANKGRIALTVTLANVFDRANVATLLPGGEQKGQRFVALTPRSLLAGITWHQ